MERRILKSILLIFCMAYLLLLNSETTCAAMADEAEEYELGEIYTGTITSPSPWYTTHRYYKFKVSEKSYVILNASVDSTVNFGMDIYNSSGALVLRSEDLQWMENVVFGKSETSQCRMLPMGDYYLDITKGGTYITTVFSFKIEAQKQLNISNKAKIYEIPDQAYSGKVIQPSIKVTYDDIVLKNGVDYKVSYKNNVYPGTATAIVTGIGNYTGTVTKIFKINIKDGTIISSNSCKYKIYNDKTATLIGVGKNLENVAIPNAIKLENMSFKVRKVSHNVLKDSTKVKTIILPETVIKLEKDSFEDISKVIVYILKGDYKYRFDKFQLDGTGTVAVNSPRNKNITNAKIPDTVTIAGVKFRITIISKNAFQNCGKLKTVTLGNNVSTLGENCFASCKMLTSVTIGTNLNKINKNAFKGDSKLTKIIIKSKKLKTVCGSIFTGINGKTVIKVPSTKLKEYQKLLKGKGQGKGMKIVKL